MANATKIDWDEFRKHNTNEDYWILVGNKIYDVSKWRNKHPGGRKILEHYAGQDATDVFHTYHKFGAKHQTIMNGLYVGELDELTMSAEELKHLKLNRTYREDVESLRKLFIEKGFLESNKWLYGLECLQVIGCEILAYLNLLYFGTSYFQLLISIIFHAIAQYQNIWFQHDLGHRMIFESRKVNDFIQGIFMGFINGLSSDFWNHRHFQHHAKPNVIDKDCDIAIEPLFIKGRPMIERAIQNRDHKNKLLSYRFQHYYFHLFGPPLLVTVFYHLCSIRHIILRRKYENMLWILGFHLKLWILYFPLLGSWGTYWYALIVCLVTSHWFTWVAQSNHLAMNLDFDKAVAWFPMQAENTCNIDDTPLNYWFTGSLCYHIEHHLFPGLPRHSYRKAQPYVKALCEKYKIPYVSKSLSTALYDVYGSLKETANLWEDILIKKDLI